MILFDKMVDELTVKAYSTREEMGIAAAKDVADTIRRLLTEKEKIGVIFAAAPSQNEFLAALCEEKDIDWNRVNAFHMDEYVGLEANAPQGFGNFLNRAIFDHLPFASVNYLANSGDPYETCKEYESLLIKENPEIVCMGIGENGHIAFNDPGVANFDDQKLVKIVKLDDICRMQQVHDGCFSSLNLVPDTAITLTIPALLKPQYVFCMVPALTKAIAVKNCLEGLISVKCPASILRNKNKAKLYLDQDSSSLL